MDATDVQVKALASKVGEVSVLRGTGSVGSEAAEDKHA